MGGGGMGGDSERVPPSKRTLVLVGRTGNGKSATGNSILGINAFKSARQSSGVTQTCELREATMKDCRVVTVIDTPGLFDSDAKSIINIGREIVKCTDLARDGIHAFLVVLSTTSRFSEEEDATIRGLEMLFDNKISSYMIVVFTGGDDIPSLPAYLESGCPEKLKKFVSRCRRRVVLFDNKTTDENKKARQVRYLLSVVDDVLLENGGQPFTTECFHESKDDEQMMLKRKESSVELEKQLVEEQDARLRAEQISQEAQRKLNDEGEKGSRQNLEKVSRTLEGQLAEEQATRQRSEQIAEEAQMKLKDMKKNLEKATRTLEEQLAEEQATRQRAEQIAQEAQMKLNDMEKNLEKATRTLEEDLIQEYASRRREEDRLGYAQMKSIDEVEKLGDNLEKTIEATREIEKQLEELQAARLRAEQISLQAEMKFSGEFEEYIEKLAKASYYIEGDLRDDCVALEEEMNGVKERLESLEKINEAAREVDKLFAEEKAASRRAKEISQEAQNPERVLGKQLFHLRCRLYKFTSPRRNLTRR